MGGVMNHIVSQLLAKLEGISFATSSSSSAPLFLSATVVTGTEVYTSSAQQTGRACSTLRRSRLQYCAITNASTQGFRQSQNVTKCNWFFVLLTSEPIFHRDGTLCADPPMYFLLS
jgi:hypothetical protein